MYYPYQSDNASDNDTPVGKEQQNLVPEDYTDFSYGFYYLPMHWQKSYGVLGTDAITLYADRSAMIKVSKDDFLLRGEQNEFSGTWSYWADVTVYDKNGNTADYKITGYSSEDENYVPERDLIFFVDVREFASESKPYEAELGFEVNGTVMHPRMSNISDEPISIHASVPVELSYLSLENTRNRFVLHPFVYADIYGEPVLVECGGTTTWAEAIENEMVTCEFGKFTIEGDEVWLEGSALYYDETFETIIKASDLVKDVDFKHLGY